MIFSLTIGVLLVRDFETLGAAIGTSIANYIVLAYQYVMYRKVTEEFCNSDHQHWKQGKEEKRDHED